jgi:hypothetical protein
VRDVSTQLVEYWKQTEAAPKVLIYRWLGEPGGEGGPFLRSSATFRP